MLSRSSSGPWSRKGREPWVREPKKSLRGMNVNRNSGTETRHLYFLADSISARDVAVVPTPQLNYTLLNYIIIYYTGY